MYPERLPVAMHPEKLPVAGLMVAGSVGGRFSVYLHHNIKLSELSQIKHLISLKN